MIDIGTVLQKSQITNENGDPVFFSIEFIKQDGSSRLIKKARRFVKKPRASKEGGKTKSLYLLKEVNGILIYDEEEQQEKTVIVDFITKFNGQIVRH